MTTKKERLQTIYAKFSHEGKEYTGRVINVDTLEHKEWLSTIVYEPSNAVLTALEEIFFTLPDDNWDKKFIGSIRNFTREGGNLSEKQSACFQKIAQRHLQGRVILEATSIDEALGMLDPNHIPF